MTDPTSDQTNVAMAQRLTVVVTGANRGIGKGICESILKSSSLPGVTLHACSRQGNDLGFQSNSESKTVVYEKLDIADHDSVSRLALSFKDQSRKVDVLINNAGINLDREASIDISRKTFAVNYYGTLDMCQSILPLMKSGGRIVNVSSIASVLKLYPEHIRERFRNARTLEDLDVLANDYLASVEAGNEEASGFGLPGRSYNVSKALLNGATRVLAEQHKDLFINSCCPGWINTDMGALVGRGASKTPEQGAIIPMRLAFGDIDDISGQFWANSSVNSTEAGQARKP